MDKGQLDDAMLHLAAGFAMQVGMKALVEIAIAGPRYSVVEYSDEGKPISSKTPINTDLDAAKALVAFGLKARDQVRVKSVRLSDQNGKVTGQLDLWDVTALGPWKLKNPADAS